MIKTNESTTPPDMTTIQMIPTFVNNSKQTALTHLPTFKLICVNVQEPVNRQMDVRSPDSQRPGATYCIKRPAYSPSRTFSDQKHNVDQPDVRV